jgi:ribosomal protein S18 acetylase RimI-like enzyme
MIRKAKKEDMGAIIDLWQEMMDFHIERSDLYQMKPNARQIYSDYLNDVLKSPEYVTLVFEIENKVLGYLIATESSDPPVYEGTVGMILELCVSKNHRNKGIGEELVAEIEKYFINECITRIECMVSDFNEVSKSFWFKNGYKPYNLMCFKILR